MLASLDSATPPTATQVAAARAAGVIVWGGYLATKPNVGLLRPWSQAEFAVIKALPGTPLAFYSGWDDPVAVKARAAAWGVRPCLDVEDGIRPDGPWVQANLDTVGGGLYSFASAFPGRRMAFAILADRSRTPPDPKATWAPWHPRPPVPCGWQWWGSHNEFGVTVDRNWLDDWFGGEQMTQAEFDALCGNSPWIAGMGWRVNALINNTPTVEGGPADVAGKPNALRAELDAMKAEIEALKNLPPGSAPSYQGTVTLTPSK
jgi:hypothetical protein